MHGPQRWLRALQRQRGRSVCAARDGPWLRIRVEQLMKTNLRKLAKSNDTSESYEARQAIKDRIRRSGIK